MALSGECRSAAMRALLVAAALSYLICVLIMSGMQKEDLDVSMLRKLQRYNVNIDDVNNENHRQECTSKNKGVTNEYQKNKNNDGFLLTTGKLVTEDTLKGLSVAALLNYIKSQQNSHFETTTKDIKQEIYTSTTEYFENPPKTDIDLLQKYVQSEKLNRSARKYETPNNNRDNHNFDIKIEEVNTKRIKDDEFIDTIFKNYLFRTQIGPATTENTIAAQTRNLQSVYKQIEDFIENSSQRNKEQISENFENNSAHYNTNDYAQSSMHITPIDKIISDRGNQIKNIYDFLTTISHFKAFSTISLPQNISTTYSIQDNKIVEKKLYTIFPQAQYEETTTKKPEPIIEVNSKGVSSDLVKEIAESVKDVIIKDLRNEFSNIYSKPVKITTTSTTTTASTTETPPTTTSKNNTKDKELAIMDTFMELYKQIKALKRTTYVLTVHNKSEAINNDFIKKPETETRLPVIDFYNNFQKPETKITVNSNYNTKQKADSNPYNARQIKNRHVPITIQTNSVEIQPLAVSVSKPESLISQNIVINSRHNGQIKDQLPRRPIPRKNRYPDIRILHRNRTHKYTPIKRHEEFNVARNPTHFGFQDVRHDDVIRFSMKNNGNSNIDMDYYEKINFGDSYSNRNVPKFHERLEGINDRITSFSDKDISDKRDRNNDAVPKRQQLSLIDMKRGTTYDDTHFKNFMKSQQKVTDILERILATRSHTSIPRSVETT